MVTKPVNEAPPLTVLYDGACPLCRREIGVYRSLRPLRSDRPVCFADVSDAALPLPPGATREQLLARFHVRGRDGQLLSGAQRFWRCGPRCRAGAGWPWLAACRAPPGPWSACIACFFAGGRRCSAGRPGWTGLTPRADPTVGLTTDLTPCSSNNQEFRMSEDPRCCGSGSCIIDAEGRCWCGQQWDGSKMCRAPLPPAKQQGRSDAESAPSVSPSSSTP